MSAGIYELNGIYAYSLDLEKKQKRKKDINIIFKYDGNLQDKDLENYLVEKVKYLNGYYNCKDSEKDNNFKLYYFYNIKNHHTIISIYDNLNDLKNEINLGDWVYTGCK